MSVATTADEIHSLDMILSNIYSNLTELNTN